MICDLCELEADTYLKWVETSVEIIDSFEPQGTRTQFQYIGCQNVVFHHSSYPRSMKGFGKKGCLAAGGVGYWRGVKGEQEGHKGWGKGQKGGKGKRESRGCSPEDSKGLVIIAENRRTASLAADCRMRRKPQDLHPMKMLLKRGVWKLWKVVAGARCACSKSLDH